MKRRGFLQALLGAALAPVITPLAIAKPVAPVLRGLGVDFDGDVIGINLDSLNSQTFGRGMNNSIYHIDELGLYPPPTSSSALLSMKHYDPSFANRITYSDLAAKHIR